MVHILVFTPEERSNMYKCRNCDNQIEEGELCPDCMIDHYICAKCDRVREIENDGNVLDEDLICDDCFKLLNARM